MQRSAMMAAVALMGFLGGAAMAATNGVAAADGSTNAPAAGACAELKAELEKLTLENSLAQQKLQAELAALQAEIARLAARADLTAKRAAADEAERKAQLDAELGEARAKLERARLAIELANAAGAEQARQAGERERDLKLKLTELQLQRTEDDAQLARLNTDLELREKRDAWKNRVNAEMAYTKEPFKDGVLTISDRRIALDGPVHDGLADYVVERINYFNNQNREFPIFIVIDASPGGSVMAGFKILKAIESSTAPVYVVVKSFAASMAATIVTLAPQSFALPNAIIMHHQMISGTFGNVTEQREGLRRTEEWWQRLGLPLSRKIGVPLDDFVKQMYANRSTGDWEEFGDKAKKLKWVGEVAETLREESYIRNPDTVAPPAPSGSSRGDESGAVLQERVDAEGRRYMLLPRISPLDAYFLYNPDGYYRLSP